MGAAAARRLAEEGAKVALADINIDGARRVAGEINAAWGEGTAFAVQLDVTREAGWIKALEMADIAKAVLYLASDESKFMTGAEMKLDGGISAM